jgi:hypothetical protein
MLGAESRKTVMLNQFWKGFVRGAKETPRGFFVPAVAAWRLAAFLFGRMVAVTDAEVAKSHRR